MGRSNCKSASRRERLRTRQRKHSATCRFGTVSCPNGAPLSRGPDGGIRCKISAPLQDQQRNIAASGAINPTKVLAPQEICFLNPAFNLSLKVGGADADVIVDDRLIDLKTSKYLRVSLQNLLQLAGYAALQSMGGVAINGRSYPPVKIQKVEIYFARFDRLASWHLDELFPKSGFERFCTAFSDEIIRDEKLRSERTPSTSNTTSIPPSAREAGSRPRRTPQTEARR